MPQTVQAEPQPAFPALAETFTEENLEAFVRGDGTLAQVLGVRAEEAYGIAQLAYNLAESGQLDDAAALAEGLVVLNPEDPYFHSLVASIYIRQERTDEALSFLDQALEIAPDDVAARVNRGEIRLNRGELEAALEDFQHAIDRDPEGVDPSGNRARMLVGVATLVLQQAVERQNGGAGEAS